MPTLTKPNRWNEKNTVEHYLVLTLYRTAESATQTLQQSVIRELTAEGLKGWTFLRGRTSTTQSEYASHLGVVLVERLAPYKGRVYDPCCGSAGMFVQSEKFVEEHGGRIGDIAVYGQESNSTTRRLAMMNLAIRGIEGDLGPVYADTFC